MKDEVISYVTVHALKALKKLRAAHRTIEKLEVVDGSSEAWAELGAILQAIEVQEAALEGYTVRLQNRMAFSQLN